MPDPRRQFNACAFVDLIGATPRAFSQAGDLVQHGETIVVVPAGTSIGVQLAPPIVSTDSFQYLQVQSDVEGVHVWPITGDPLPSVSPTLRPFGPLWDYSEPVYGHAHGAFSLTAGTHAGGVPYYASLPSWFSNVEDEVDPTADHAVVTRIVGPQFSVAHCGMLLDMTWTTGATFNKVRSLLRWGMRDAQDLGDDYGDDLEFYAAVYLGDETLYQTNGMALNFFGYPFSGVEQNLSAFVGLATQSGEEVWADNDPHLGYEEKGTLNPTISHGFDLSIGGTQGLLSRFRLVPTGWTPVRGWNLVRFVKDPALSTFYGDATPRGSSERATFHRITMVSVDLFVAAPLLAGTVENYIGAIWFQPRSGKIHTLRPSAHLSARWWPDDSAIGVALQNPTDRDAMVTMRLGVNE